MLRFFSIQKKRKKKKIKKKKDEIQHSYFKTKTTGTKPIIYRKHRTRKTHSKKELLSRIKWSDLL